MAKLTAEEKLIRAIFGENLTETEITLTLYRGLSGTNPSAFRVDIDGVSVFENPLPEYKFNLPIRAIYEGEKSAGTIAKIIEPVLAEGIAEFTPQFGEGHWSLRFPNMEAQEIKILLSQYAKSVLK